MRRAMFFEMEFKEQCPEFMMLSELDREIVFYFRSENYLCFLRSEVLQTFAQKITRTAVWTAREIGINP